MQRRIWPERISAPPPGWYYTWIEMEQMLRTLQMPDSDWIVFDVMIYPVEMPKFAGEIRRARVVAAKQRLDRDPRDRNFRFDRASAFTRLGEFPKALDDLDALVSEAPPDSVAEYRWSRAILRARLGQKREALDDLAKAVKNNLSASGNVYAAAAVAAELGEGERDAFEHLESAMKEKPGDPELHYRVSCAYSLASQAVARQGKSRGRVYAERAVELLRAAIRNGFSNKYSIEHDPDLDPIRSSPGFAELMRAEHLDRLVGGLLVCDGSRDAIQSFELDPAVHLRNSRDLFARGYRPVSVSVCRTEPNGSLVSASAWHRPIAAEQTKEEAHGASRPARGRRVDSAGTCR